MRQQILLSFFLFISLAFLNISYTLASVLTGASCNVTARVIDKGVETKQVYDLNGEISGEYKSKFLEVEILTTRRVGILGNCDFISKGDVFKIDGGSNPDLLNVGEIIEAGVEMSSAMTPSGVASSFIHWEPISLIDSERTLPTAFHLQSSNEPEKHVVKGNENAGILLPGGKFNDVMSDNESEAKVEDGNSNKNELVVIIVATTILIVGGVVYLFKFYRQRKT